MAKIALPRISIPKLVVPRLPVPKLQLQSAQRRLAVVVIGLTAAIVAILTDQAPITREAFLRADHVFYDWFYTHRPIVSQRDSDVTIVAVDRRSLDDVERALQVGWPWGRSAWSRIATYLQHAGARAVAFDMTFSRSSARGPEDDELFSEELDSLTIPVAFARELTEDGEWGPFKPTLRRPHEFGYVDVTSEKVYRDYIPRRGDKLSLAAATLRAAGIEPRLPLDRPFLLHFYGPHRDPDNQPTFAAWSASHVLAAADDPDSPNVGVRPEYFRGKLVIVGAVAATLQDIKSVPNSPRMPGVEIQATALANLLYGDAVRAMPPGTASVVALAGALVAAAGTIGLRSATLKFITIVLVCAGLIAGSFLLFRLAHTIFWLPPAMPLFAVALAAVGGITWSYFLEDRQARMLLKALETCLSPSVAAELARNPRKLAVGGQQLDMTVMFTDLAGFTSLTEELKERIEPALNFYLGEMTEQILRLNGTLDKYIGDAIMTFWNAPVDQPEHARHACEAALAIQRRERELRQPLAELGMRDTVTRIGINSGPMFVGFTGSHRKLNYTVIGDAVNLAARLEPANKLYGTQI
ncbi:MAG: adenylate/guanylate cyclase domain-containing protein, partial [Phycisphaerae bacterium]|nr:adenylate/guanylate cyclase domain-containing protein [Phycisphaerae bacterium]